MNEGIYNPFTLKGRKVLVTGVLAYNRLKASSMRLSVSSDAVSFPAGGIRLFQDVGTVGL